MPKILQFDEDAVLERLDRDGHDGALSSCGTLGLRALGFVRCTPPWRRRGCRRGWQTQVSSANDDSSHALALVQPEC